MTIRELGPEDMIVCPVGEHGSDHYLPYDLGPGIAKSGANAVFQDSLLNVSEEFVPAIDFVLEFLERFFQSEVPINVWFELEQLGGNALAGARPAFLVENFPFAPRQDTEYPIALAEKILGREINDPDQPDILVTINADFEAWHLEPNDPNGINRTEIDLASVLTHELIHGLGFYGNGRIDNIGRGRLTGFLERGHPITFDRNMMNGQGEFLFETFDSPSRELADQFTSNDLFYNSESFQPQSRKPKLYAPRTFAPGSSLAHLDEQYNGGGDALMTFAFGGGEILYFPGNITLDMLYDMGWDATRIIHQPALFSEDVNAPYEIFANIEADSGFEPTSFQLHFSTDRFATMDSVITLAFDTETELYKAVLPAPGEPVEYQYYFEVQDGRGITRTRPGGGPDYYFTYNYGDDTGAPVMSDAGDIRVSVLNDAFPVSITAIDTFSGVSSVSAVIKINGVLDTVALEQSEFDNGQFFFTTYEFDRTFVPTDTIEYKFFAFDNSSNANYSEFPADSLLKGTYVVDEFPPQLEHDPLTSVTNFDRSFRVRVSTFDDFTGIDEVFAIVQVNEGVPDTFQLSYAPTLFGDFYEGSYVHDRAFLPTDIIRYSIFATDKAYVPNTSVLPVDSEFYQVSIIEIPDPVNTYINDFNAATADFNGNGFTIGSVTGFSDEAIQSAEHPYPEGGPGQVIDLTYELVRPIIVAESESFIEFDEIALVEFGEPGSRWPSDRFYDYVIVEARKLRGVEYFPLIEGYDCSDDPEWKSTYESRLNSQGISTAEPTPNLLRHRVIDIRERGDLVAGDTILVRFRLFSDNAAAGWGWLIDNLVIQGESTPVRDITLAGDIKVYPNPVQGDRLNVSLGLEEQFQNGVLTVYNLLGERMLQQPTGRIDRAYQTSLDISTLSKGMYLLEIRLDQQYAVTRKFIVGE